MIQPRHFIIVDDDTTSNLICEFGLRKMHPQAVIRSYTDPVEALAVIRKYGGSHKDSVVLFLDINMPKMSAWDFLEIFSKYDEQVRSLFRIFIISSAIDDFKEEKMQYPLVSGFLTKPMTRNNLEEALEHLLNPGLNAGRPEAF